MTRESETMFRDLPDVHLNRSKMDIPHNLKTTWTVGRLIPIYVSDVVPGSTISMRMSAVMRMTTPLYPTMDNLYTDIMFFFVPYRLIWEHWKEFWGENPNAWYPSITYNVPHVLTDSTHKFSALSIADYMGLPLGQEGLSVNALPFRGFTKIWNDWFRSTPLQQEYPCAVWDNDEYANPNRKDLGGIVPHVGKLHDLFTSALPYPERSAPITLPLGTVAPVITKSDNITPNNPTALKWKHLLGNTFNASKNIYGKYDSSTPTELQTKAGGTAPTDTSEYSIYPSNLWADLTNATGPTLQSIREALACAHFFERAALYGGRYTEILKGIYGVDSPDGRLQRSEYLGGHRIVHNMQTVVQTSSTDSTSPQGNTGAYSHTVDSEDYFTKSFTEHGVLIGVMCTRYKHTYQDNVPKIFSQRKFTDYYLPQFEGIGQVPIKNKEVWYSDTLTDNDDVFGYAEYGYEWKYYPDTVTGLMRSSATGTLDSWHYADNYNARPVLGATWIQEDKNNVDRTLTVATYDQLFGDFYFKPTYVLPMPTYSMPGMTRI